VLLLILQPPSSPLFPYTTLFRSCWASASFAPAITVSLRRQRLSERSDHHISDRSVGSRACRYRCQLRALVRPWTAVLLLAEAVRSEEHTSELQSQSNLVCRLLLE